MEDSSRAEVHHYIKVNTLTSIQQLSEEDVGKVHHYIRLYATGIPMVLLEFSAKDEADKVCARILESVSARNKSKKPNKSCRTNRP
jgi:hypothetical protein